MALRMLAAGALAAAVAASGADLYAFIARQANATNAQVKSYTQYPTNGAWGQYGWQTGAYDNWVSGFYPGLLMKLSNYTAAQGDAAAAQEWLDLGIARAAAIAQNQYNGGTHDVGFMVYYTFGQQYALTGNTTARDITIQTAHTLATRFDSTVGCIRSWNSAYPTFEVIADNLMNLELLWWAGVETGNSTLTSMARSHADHMIRDLFQPITQQGSTGCAWHLITYDQRSGAILNRSSTPQGLGLNTIWSRGQAWSIYGFVVAYRYTGDAAYLKQAQEAANCFVRLTQMNAGTYGWAPLWDFNVTAPQLAVDTSAAMVAADALIELAWQTSPSNPALASALLAAAKQMLTTATTLYLASPATTDAVLLNGTVTYPLYGIPIIYGDYYLLEGSMRWDATPAGMQATAQGLIDSGADIAAIIAANTQ